MSRVLKNKASAVASGRDFVFAAAYLEHAHILSQCQGLTDAGGFLKWVYDPDPVKVTDFLKKFPGAAVARSFAEILDDSEVRLVAAAAIPSERGSLGCRVMEAGKDYFTAKAPFTDLAQLTDARAAVARTGRKYAVYFSERLHSESGMFATELVQEGSVGRVLSVIGLGPHRVSAATRPAWFFERARSGGILCDLGSHQCEQFLTYSGATAARVVHAAVGNFANPATPEFQDYGEASIIGDNGATGSFRVDWFTPGGLRTWGDGRIIIMGTKGYIELRKNLDVARDATPDHVYLVDDRGEHYHPVAGRGGCRYFGELILDCLHRTETAMTQTHAFKAAELCLRAQAAALNLTPATLR